MVAKERGGGCGAASAAQNILDQCSLRCALRLRGWASCQLKKCDKRRTQLLTIGALYAALVMRMRQTEEDTKKYGAPLGQAILVGAAGITAIGLGIWGEGPPLELFERAEQCRFGGSPAKSFKNLALDPTPIVHLNGQDPAPALGLALPGGRPLVGQNPLGPLSRSFNSGPPVEDG